MINPNRDLWKWGPIDGQILYMDDFMIPMTQFRNKFDMGWGDVLFYIKDGMVVGILDHKNLYNNGEEMFKHFFLNEKNLEKYFKIWNDYKDELIVLAQKYKGKDLKSISDEKLKWIVKEFYRLNDNFWIYGFVPEVSNFGGEQMLKREVEKNHKDNFIEIVEALSAPEELSFFQIEERDLLKIKLNFSKEALEEHQKKYFWITSDYGETRVANIDYFKKLISEVSRDEAKKKIAEIENFTEKTKKKKAEVIKKYNISQEIQNIGSKLSYSIWWQDYRKKYIFMNIHFSTKFSKELGRRNGLTLEDMYLYGESEVIKLAVEGIKVDNLEERKKGYISYYREKENDLINYFGDEANKLKEKYDTKVEKDVNEVKGMVTSKGIAKGKVKVIIGSKDFHKMEEGDILVTSMTSPDFIVLMRKASAIITDEGGMTSHAAIVSRELGTPCIVGTKIATKVFKDNDVVEVDADKGVVRKVE